MRNTTKLKRILEHHVVGLSMSDDNWEISIINSETKRRIQISGKSYSEIIRKAFDAVKVPDEGLRTKVKKLKSQKR